MLGLVITGCMFVALFGWTLPALAQPGVEAARGQTAGAATRVAGDAVAVEVYKKWIGAAGDEADVEIHLVCGDDASFPPLSVNQGKSAVWSIGAVTAAGTFCTVLEVERDSFIGDDSDCRDLLLLPGQGAECTLVNTKLVKRIDMLNRYGLVMMIAVMMGAGLAAVRRYH
jgi:hypothetical protein